MKEYFDEMLEELNSCEDKMEKLKLIVEYGKELEEFPEENKLDKYKVPGCISNVYLFPELKENSFYIHATSDALIVAGYLAMILEGINGNSPQKIVDNWDIVEQFTKDAGFKENLSPTRANAFGTILSLIYSYAQAHLE